MIWYYLFLLPVVILNTATSWLPQVDTLPAGIDQWLAVAFGYFFEFKEIMPPVALMFNFVLVYLGFRLTLIVMKQLRIWKH